MWLESGLRGVRSTANSGFCRRYCLAEVQVPPQPSERRQVPDPLRPERRPAPVKVTPWPCPCVETEPLELTVPLTPSPMTLPELTTTAPLVEPPQPTLVTIQAPSKLPLPPPLPLRRGEERSSAVGLLRRADGAGSAERSDREPDSDFSSLPIEPPALPDCARTDGAERARRSAARPTVRLAAFDMSEKSIIVKNQRPEPSAQTAPTMRQALPALPQSSSAASFARCTPSRWTSDQDLSDIANAPQLLP